MSRVASTARLFAGVSVLLAAAAFDAGAAPQTIPDFSSNQAAWRGANGSDFIPVPGSPSPMTDDPAHPHVGNNTGKQPAYRIADLSNPNLMQWAKDIMKKDNDEVLAGKIAYTPGQSCKPSGVPDYNRAGGPFFFIQTEKEVLQIATEERHARHIYLNVPHSANPRPSWYGESIGHYEGDTLVVDTIGQNTKTFVDAYRTPHTDKLHVVERWRVINDGKQIEVHMTIEDPGTYYRPWQAIRRLGRVQDTLGEEICQEGNFILFDYGIPVADKPDF